MRLKANVNPKIVSERLGHASVALTLDTYSHVLPTMQESAVTAVGQIFYTDQREAASPAELVWHTGGTRNGIRRGLPSDHRALVLRL